MQSCKSEFKTWKTMHGARMHEFVAPWKCSYGSIYRLHIYLLIHACFSTALHTEPYLYFFCRLMNPFPSLFIFIFLTFPLISRFPLSLFFLLCVFYLLLPPSLFYSFFFFNSSSDFSRRAIARIFFLKPSFKFSFFLRLRVSFDFFLYLFFLIL